MKGITWNGEELGASFDIGDIPDNMKDQVSGGLGFRVTFNVRARV